MKMAFIVMAYKDPDQIERLVKKMSHPAFDFYIHVDSKFDLKPFKYLEETARVFIIKNRAKVRWAGYSFTKTLFACVKEVLTLNLKYDFITSLSGQDYPIKSNKEIYSFFEGKEGTNFIDAEKFGSSWWEETRNRVEQYHLTDFDFRGRHRLAVVVNKILPKRKFPLGYTLYGSGRATWWSMTEPALAYTIKFMDEHPGIERFTRLTWGPDEFIVPTIIMNSPFKDTVIRDNYRYLDRSLGGPNPKILTDKDFDALKNNKNLFARKFDIKVNTRIFDLVDEITI